MGMGDAFAIFDDNRDVTAAVAFTATTVVSNRSYDTGVAGTPPLGGSGLSIGGPLIHDIGRGRKLQIIAQVQTTLLASGGAATVEVDFISATDEALTGTVTAYLKTAAIAKASLVAGYRWRFGSVPAGVAQRFVGVQWVIATNTITSGNVYSALEFAGEDNADILG